MTRSLTIALVATAAFSVACVEPDCDGCGYEDDPIVHDEPTIDPNDLVAASCAELADLAPDAPDGAYTLRIDGRDLDVQCVDMASNPREYLPLPAGNFSQYTASADQGETVRTEFDLVAIDLETLTIDLADHRFSRSSGSLMHGDELVTAMPFAVAMSCTGSDDGAARVDLRGTGLAIDATWRAGGYRATGDVRMSDEGQVADVRGGGVCGWAYPGEADAPFNDHAGFDLQLRWADTAATPVDASSCAELRAYDLSADDGLHTLNVRGRAIEIECVDIRGAALDYLPLSGENFSGYAAGAGQGSNVRTEFDAVRIDLASLTVHMADYRFATSTGSLVQGSDVVTRMPFGVAMSCTGGLDGAARIDLRGTPLAVADAYQAGGWEAGADAAYSSDDQVVDVSGGGSCGWAFPGDVFNPINDNAGFDLQLRVL